MSFDLFRVTQQTKKLVNRKIHRFCYAWC